MAKTFRYSLPALALVAVVSLAAWLVWYADLLAPARSTSISSLANAAPQRVESAGSLHDTLIPESDLPPEGTRSLFDHLIFQNDVLPYPFEKLIALLQKQNPQGLAPLTLLIPKGRSLLKGQADYAHPRVVVAADYQAANTPVALGVAPLGQLFLGFVENANEIEVLSYNEAAGRMEFQLVQNYCEGCVPRIVYARRAICTTCHQGATPIFSQRPWNETNGQQATADAIVAARGGDPYQGVPVRQPLSVPERFDQLTDVGNFLKATQKLWLDGCGKDGNDCRRQMLALALQYSDNPGGFNPHGAGANRLRDLQAKHYPAEGIAVPESDLRNRDPLAETLGFKGWLRSWFVRDFSFGDGAKDNEDLTRFDQLPTLPAEVDPLVVRAPKQRLHATDIDGVYGVAALFTDADLKLLAAAFQYKQENLQARVAALPDEVFAPRPISRVAMLNALLAEPKQYCCLDAREMSAPAVSGVPPLKIVKQERLMSFEQYCFACHRGNPSKRLDFMSGANEDEVLTNLQAKKEIRDALDWERYENTEQAGMLMPPRDSVQYERLKTAGPEVRNAMRDTVPGLFEF
jgi:hypothetical protein